MKKKASDMTVFEQIEAGLKDSIAYSSGERSLVTRRIFAPDYVSPPGDTIRETLQARGMTQAEFARRMGISQYRVRGLLKGTAAITSETALNLEKVLEIPARFWENRERHYREFLEGRGK